MDIKHIFKNSMTAFGVVAVMSFSFIGNAHAAGVAAIGGAVYTQAGGTVSSGTAEYLSLIGVGGLTTTTTVEGLAPTQVNCAEPPKSTALNWQDCIGGLQNSSVAGLFGFDIDSLMQSLATAACSYAEQQTGAYLGQASAAVDGAILGAGGGTVGTVLDTVGTIGSTGSVSTPIGTVGTGITQGGAGGTQGAVNLNTVTNPFTGQPTTIAP